jgi:esterase/lipase superfamily enzyme
MTVWRGSASVSSVRRYAWCASIVVLCIGLASCRSLPPRLERSVKDYARAEKDAASVDAQAEGALVAEAKTLSDVERSKGFGQPASPKAQGRAIDVYYATTRRRSGRREVSQFYGVDRIRKPAPAEYGIVTVNIPAGHQKGMVERPWSVFTVELKENVEKHVMLVSVRPQSKEALLGQLDGALREQGTAFVYVHGYYNSFADAARKTAQIATDLNIGVPIMFSWASQDRFWGYFDDQESSRDAIDYLADFLDDIQAQTSAKKIHLIAHSMGNEVLTQALKIIANRNAGKASAHRFAETILAAPDVDTGVFLSAVDLAKTISARVTTYVSSSDLAMMASNYFRKSSSRAGDSQPEPVVIEGVDTVDISAASNDWLGHNYATSNQSVLRDLWAVVQGTQADERGLTAAFNSRKARYWIFGTDIPKATEDGAPRR